MLRLPAKSTLGWLHWVVHRSCIDERHAPLPKGRPEGGASGRGGGFYWTNQLEGKLVSLTTWHDCVCVAEHVWRSGLKSPHPLTAVTRDSLQPMQCRQCFVSRPHLISAKLWDWQLFWLHWVICIWYNLLHCTISIDMSYFISST